MANIPSKMVLGRLVMVEEAAGLVISVHMLHSGKPHLALTQSDVAFGAIKDEG